MENNTGHTPDRPGSESGSGPQPAPETIRVTKIPDKVRGAEGPEQTEQRIRCFLDMRVPKEWGNMDAEQRRAYFEAGADAAGLAGVQQRDKVSDMEIWVECLSREPEQLSYAASCRLAELMAGIAGWRRSPVPIWFPPYGYQRLYRRREDPEPPDPPGVL